MALRGYDGFDHYGSATDLLARNGFIQYSTVGPHIGLSFSSPGRANDGKSLSIVNSDAGTSEGVYATFGQRVASAFIGFGFRNTVTPTLCTFEFMDTVAAAPQVSVVFNSSNYSIAIHRGSSSGTLLYLSPNNVWAGDVWNFVEIWPVIASSGGSVSVWVNGEPAASVTGVNTQATANAWWDQVGFLTTTAGNSYNGLFIDDLYYADSVVGAGTYPCDSPLGDLHVFTKYPIGNDTVQWTPLANSNWQEVNEVAMDSDTSYNFTTTAGDEDLLNFAALESTISKIVAVQLTGAYRKDDAGMRTLKQALKSSATEVYGPTYSLPGTSYVYYTDLYVLDPNTSASWTLSNVNALAGGYNLVS